MDPLYTTTLLISLLTSGGALLLGVVGTLSRVSRPGLDATGRILAWIATISLAVSIGVHWPFGHGAGSPEPMGPARFGSEHPAFLLAAVLAITAALLNRPSNRNGAVK